SAKMPKLMRAINMMDAGNDLLSTFLATVGHRFYTNQPAAIGVKSAVTNMKIICSIGILNCELPSNEYTMAGSTNGTARDVTITIATTKDSCRLFFSPSRVTLITNGAPRPVETPDNNSTGIANGS